MGSGSCGSVIDPKDTCLWIPANLRKFKLNLFQRVGQHIVARGGRVIHGDIGALERLPDKIIPIVGCNPELTELILRWKAAGRKRVQWDRGYARRVFATWLPRGENGGYYRWHVDSFQLRTLRDVPTDRWDALNTPLKPWQKNGKHIVVLAPTPNYTVFHRLGDWLEVTLRTLSKQTERQVVVRQKDSTRPLQYDLEGAHAAVSCGSIAATEAVILGCPIFDHPESAATLMGLSDLAQIERPIYPDRTTWASSLAYSQFNEAELVDGTLWRFLE